MLVGDAVEHGSHAVEKLQKDVAQRPFAVLEAIPGLAAPATVVHAAHDLMLGATHRSIRLANRLLGVLLDTVMVAAEDERHRD